MSFTDIQDHGPGTSGMGPPDNCLSCLLLVTRDSEEHPQIYGSTLTLNGSAYHSGDFVLMRRLETEEHGSGPASIGQILALHSARGSARVTIQLLGRISDIIEKCPKNVVKDEVRIRLGLGSVLTLGEATSFYDRRSKGHSCRGHFAPLQGSPPRVHP